jgi:hypothetical protein
MAGCVVEKKEPLSIALGEAFENVDGMINLSEKVLRAEVTIAVFARLEDDPGLPDECKDL